MFPEGFLWGAATAGYQVEGTLGNADWDVFVTTPEIVDRVRRFALSATGQVVDYVSPGGGVGHEDVDILRVELDRARSLGMNAYRFSVEWNRLQEKSRGSELEPVALEHYLTVIKEILDRGMTPVLSLNHMSLPAWALTPPKASMPIHPFAMEPFVDLPVAAEDDQWTGSLRGWEGDETVAAYGNFVGAFAKAVKTRFPNALPLWLTLNEPIGSMVGVGYLGALWCPGFGGQADRGKRVCLNLVKAHVRTYDAIKGVDKAYQVGFAHAMMLAVPTSYSSVAAGFLTGLVAGALLGGVAGAQTGAVVGAIIGFILLGPIGLLIGLILGAIAGAIQGALIGAAVGGAIGAVVGAAENVQQRALDQFDYFFNDWILNALAKGEVDTEFDGGARRLQTEAEWDEFHGFPAATPIGNKLDFVGLNYYRRVHVYYHPFTVVVPYVGGRFNDSMEGDDDRDGVLNELGWEVFPSGLRTFSERLRDDYGLPILVTENGYPERLDANRAAYVVAHLTELHDVMTGPNPPQIVGYLHWSIVDNYEWHHGYEPRARFGLFSTGDRDAAGNSVAIKTKTTFRRQLTDGALALRSVIETKDPAAAFRRFGAVHPGGGRISPPEQSNGAIWKGTLGASDIKLFLDSTGAHTHTGLIYYAQENLWVPVSAIDWRPADRRIRFSHEDMSLMGIPGRDVSIHLDGAGEELSGQAAVSASGVADPVLLTRVLLHGLWFPEEDGLCIALAFHVLRDGGAVAKLLPDGHGERWQAFRLGVPNGAAENREENNAFEVKLGPNERHLDLVVLGASSFGFNRAPSSLAFLGEN